MGLETNQLRGVCCNPDKQFNMQHGNTRIDTIEIPANINELAVQTSHLFINASYSDLEDNGIDSVSSFTATKNEEVTAPAGTFVDSYADPIGQTGTLVFDLVSFTFVISLPQRGNPSPIATVTVGGSDSSSILSLYNPTTLSTHVTINWVAGLDNYTLEYDIFFYNIYYGLPQPLDLDEFRDLLSYDNQHQWSFGEGDAFNQFQILETVLYGLTANDVLNKLLLIKDVDSSTVDGFRRPFTRIIGRDGADVDDTSKIFITIISNDRFVTSSVNNSGDIVANSQVTCLESSPLTYSQP
jgi:hypothetical protein